MNTMRKKLPPCDMISKAKVELHRFAPFFSYLVEYLQYIEDATAVPTAGVTKNSRCYYNPEYISKLSINTLMAVLAHEVGHLAFKHINRKPLQDVKVNGTSLWNIAIDISLNYFLGLDGFTLPEDGLIPINGSINVYGYELNNIGDKAAEEIFTELKKYFQKLLDKQPADQDGEGDGTIEGLESKNNKSKPRQSGKSKKARNNINTGHEPMERQDCHMWGDNAPKDEKEDGGGQGNDEKDGNGGGDVPDSGKGNGNGDKKDDDGPGTQNAPTIDNQKNWDQILANAKNHAKMCGKEPAGIKREWDNLHKPRVNWRAILKRTIAAKLPYDLSYHRPNKKYIPMDIYQPVFVGEKVAVITAIDTSGSISHQDMSDFLSEMIGISQSFTTVDFTILTHDCVIHQCIHITDGNIRKIKQIVPEGGGGTNHVPVYEYIKEHKLDKRTKLLVCFTDGFSVFPNKRPKLETTFVLAGDHCGKDNIPRWANTVIIKE